MWSLPAHAVDARLLKFAFQRGTLNLRVDRLMPGPLIHPPHLSCAGKVPMHIDLDYEGCVGGCDSDLNDLVLTLSSIGSPSVAARS